MLTRSFTVLVAIVDPSDCQLTHEHMLKLDGGILVISHELLHQLYSVGVVGLSSSLCCGSCSSSSPYLGGLIVGDPVLL